MFCSPKESVSEVSDLLEKGGGAESAWHVGASGPRAHRGVSASVRFLVLVAVEALSKLGLQ